MFELALQFILCTAQYVWTVWVHCTFSEVMQCQSLGNTAVCISASRCHVVAVDSLIATITAYQPVHCD